MRIHVSSAVTILELQAAARDARVYFDRLTEHRSRTHDHAFDVILRGESRRAPNHGTSRTVERTGNPERAATWDQWGVFLAHIFAADPNARTPYDASADAFRERTDWRFEDRSSEVDYATKPVYWPADAHGDHHFAFAGVPREQSCTRCSAVQRWAA